MEPGRLRQDRPKERFPDARAQITGSLHDLTHSQCMAYEPQPPHPPRFNCTEISVALADTLTAALALGDDTCALNFANDLTPGGGTAP